MSQAGGAPRVMVVVVPVMSSLAIGAIGLVVEIRLWAVVAAAGLLVVGGALGFVETGRPAGPVRHGDDVIR